MTTLSTPYVHLGRCLPKPWVVTWHDISMKTVKDTKGRRTKEDAGQKQIIGFTWFLIYGMELVGMGWSLKIPWTLLLLSKS